MKILMVLMGLEIGGAETHVAEFAMELARRGHCVHIASKGGVYEKEIRKSGIIHHKLPLHTKNPFSVLKSYLGLKKIISQNKFDIVHAHARIPAYICSRLHKKLKFRFITTAHWVFKTNFLLKRITNWGERTIAVSNDIKSYLQECYDYPAGKIHVTINGIDTEKFSLNTDWSDIKSEFNLEDNKFRIVYVSRMDTDRSAVAFNLLDIAPVLCKKYPETEIVIVGGGNDYERLIKKVDEVNSAVGHRAVIATGPRTDINKFVASGNMFVGVSRAALEAMSASKPVIIAGNEGYIGIFGKDKEEISVKTNFCCRGCPMPDNEILLEDILKVIESKNIEDMATFNRQYILDNYSVAKMTDDYEEAYDALLQNNPFRENDILVSGYYGFNNVGDDSLLKAIVQNIRAKNKNTKITVLSKKPDETRALFQVESVNRYNLLKIFFLLKHTRLLISGGGSLLQDVTSTKSYRYYSTIIKMAMFQGAKVMVYANGIGPITSKSNRKDCKNLIEMVNVITLRDKNSQEELINMGVKRDISVTADPAFSLDCQECKIPKEDYFIVSVRRWKELPENFTDIIGAVCKVVKDKFGLLPVFVPMHPKLDFALCNEICKECGGTVLGSANKIEELLYVVKNSRFVMGMRLHILIYSLSMGVPVIPLSYDPKVDAITDQWQCCTGFSAEEINEEKLVKQIEYVMENREELCESISEISNKMRDKTSKDAETALKLMKF